MADALRYRELTPPPDLRRHVRCLWHLAVDAAAGHVQTVYPDGCCELIAHRKAPLYTPGPDGAWQRQAHSLFAGQQRSAVQLAAREDADCIGVRLQPAASALLLRGRSAAGLRDRIVDLAEVDAALAGEFLAVATLPEVDAAIAALHAWLRRHLLPLPLDARIEGAVRQLETRAGAGPVAPAIAASGMGERSFQNAFRDQVGLSAKEFARILRLQATLRRLDSGAQSVAEAALEAGFADQAHATREVRRVTGTTPARLRRALREDRDGAESVRLAAAFVRGRTGR